MGPARRAGPGGRLRPRRGHPHPRGRGRRPGARRRRASKPTASTASGGARPARRSPKARATPSSPPRSASRTSPAAPCSPARRTPAWTRCSAAADAVGAGSAPRRARRRLRRAASPGSGTGFEARCGAGAAAIVLAAEGGTAVDRRPGHPHRTRSLDRYRGDGETDDPRPLRRRASSARRCSSRSCARSASTSRRSTSRAWSLPDPDGRLGAARRQAGRRRRTARRPRSTPRSATPAPPPRCSARIGALDARRHGRHRRLPAAAARPASSCTPTRRFPAPPPSPTLLERAARVRTPRCCGPAASSSPAGETIPMGVPPESALFVRGADEMLGLLGGRCVDCGTISTPPSIHPHCIACGGPKLEPVAARAARHGAHVRGEPDDAGAVRRAAADRGPRPRRRRAASCCRSSATAPTSRSAPTVELVLRRYAHERGVPVYGFKAERDRGDGTEGARSELEPGRRRRRRAHQVRRAVRPELRADGRRRVRAPRSTRVDKGFDPQQVDAAFVATQRGTLWGQEGIGGNTVPTAIGLNGIAVHPDRERVPVGLRRVPGRRDGRRQRRARRRARDRRREDARQVDRGGPALPGRGRATRSSPGARPRRCCSRRSPPATCTSSARPARCSRRSR